MYHKPPTYLSTCFCWESDVTFFISQVLLRRGSPRILAETFKDFGAVPVARRARDAKIVGISPTKVWKMMIISPWKNIGLSWENHRNIYIYIYKYTYNMYVYTYYNIIIYIYHLFTCCTCLLYRYIGNNMVIFGFVWKWGDPKLWPFLRGGKKHKPVDGLGYPIFRQTDAGVTR